MFFKKLGLSYCLNRILIASFYLYMYLELNCLTLKTIRRLKCLNDRCQMRKLLIASYKPNVKRLVQFSFECFFIEIVLTS